MWGGAFFQASLIQKTKKKPHPPGTFPEFPLYVVNFQRENSFIFLHPCLGQVFNFLFVKTCCDHFFEFDEEVKKRHKG